MRRTTEESYTAKAVFFDGQVRAEWAAEAYGAGEQPKLARLFDALDPLAGVRLLEPGCGTGRLTELLAREVGPKGLVVATDISPRMVAETRARLVNCHWASIHLGPAEALSGYEEAFDCVICHQVFPHFEDKSNTLDKLTRMLKPDGRLVISHFISSAEINDVHRKAGTAVEKDLMPPPETLRRWCSQCRLSIDRWEDDAEGYLLCAMKR
jgi:demethylmenaquinone methyltransferase/2-methoxy-6-polyprenyl-1,4-benzoquinol methylase